MKTMKTTLGFTIKRMSRRKLLKTKTIPLCYSCDIPSSGGWDGIRHWVCTGHCDGFIRGVNEDRFVIKCSGYKEQKFNIPKEVKEKLQDWVDEYCYRTLEGKRNITQQSDNWFAMELEILAGIIDTLQNRQSLNDLIHRGERLLKKTKGSHMGEVTENLLADGGN
jgi:hypothetical protein